MKRILSILLTALMVLTIIPVSVFMASAKTVTFTDKALAAGESTTETIDLSKVDRTKPLTITMDVKAANATSTANGKDAVLKIGGVRTIRITGGAGIIITGYQSSFQQWNNANGTNNFVITIDFAAATISFVGANRSLTVALSEIGIDVSGDSLVLQFGDADTGACSFKNISVNYTEKAGGGNVEEPEAIETSKTLAAGESYTYTLDLANIDRSKNIVLKFDASTDYVNGGVADNAVLSINGKRTLRVTTGGGMHIWDEKAGGSITDQKWKNSCAGITVTINLNSGVVNFAYDGVNVNLTSLDLSGDTLTFKFGGANTAYVNLSNISLSYTQSGDNSPSTLLEVGAKDYPLSSASSYDDYTVVTAGSSGKITVVFVTGNTNWQASYNVLSINGKAIISAAGTSGNAGYTMGTSTTPIYTWDGRTYTIVIDPLTGDVEIDDGKGNTATANVGSAMSSFTMKVGAAYSNSWKLKSITVTQEAAPDHICEYETTVTPATCITPEITAKSCTSCTNKNETFTAPAEGHEWGAWVCVNGRQSRSCSSCGRSEDKEISFIDGSKKVVAFGDSCTWGTKAFVGGVEGPNNAYPKYLADHLGMEWVNSAVPGSESYQWQSILLNKAAPNGKTYDRIGNNIYRDDIIELVESAGVIVFTLGNNDSLFYTETRSASNILLSIREFVDEINRINPDAIVVIVSYSYTPITWPGHDRASAMTRVLEVADALKNMCDSEEYNDFVYFVECVDVFSNESFIDGDDVHPNAAGHKEIAENVISTLGYTSTEWNVTYAHSATFGNDLSINYYLPASAFEGCTDIRLVIDKGGNETVITDYIITSDGYKFTFDGVAACEAGETITATVYAKKNGVDICAAADTYSFKDYAYNMLTSTADQEFKTLLVDTLNYCAAAQTYFGYNTDALVNAELTDAQKAYGTQSKADVSSAPSNDDTKGVVLGKSVVFNSNVEMKFYMDLSKCSDVTRVTVKVAYKANGVATERTIEYQSLAHYSDGDLYAFKLTDIAAADLRDSVSVTVYYDGEAISDTVTYSVAAYAKSRLENSTDNSFKALLEELMKYIDSANSYFY